MNFNIIKNWEKLYKIFLFISVLIITILAWYWYLSQNDKTDTFIVSLLYALYLFGVGIYVNYMKNKIDEKYYERKDYYLILGSLEAMFKTMKLVNYTDEEVFVAVIWFQTFTSRTDVTKDKQAFIPEKGYNFNLKELVVEDEFLEKRNIILENINTKIKDYIDQNSIIKKGYYPNICKLQFEVGGWCCEYFELDKEELERMESFIYDLFSQLQNKMDELEYLMKKIVKFYNSYEKKVKSNIKSIEGIYGSRLEYESLKENQFTNETSQLSNAIERIENDICINKEIANDNRELKKECHRLNETIMSLEKNLTSQIESVKDELLEKL
jgi:hypothetical protein